MNLLCLAFIDVACMVTHGSFLHGSSVIYACVCLNVSRAKFIASYIHFVLAGLQDYLHLEGRAGSCDSTFL